MRSEALSEIQAEERRGRRSPSEEGRKSSETEEERPEEGRKVGLLRPPKA